MNIKEIKGKIKFGEYEISYHAEKERYAEDITIPDIEAVILNGELLEDYPEDPRGPSCLILGYSQDRPIHSCMWLYIVEMDQNNNSIFTKTTKMD